MLHKNKAYRRYQRSRHISRRKAICNTHYTTAVMDIVDEKGNVIGQRADYSRVVPSDFYKFDGMYDKGKIHCGCPVCKPTKRFRKPSFKDEVYSTFASEYIKDYLNGAA